MCGKFTAARQDVDGAEPSAINMPQHTDEHIRWQAGPALWKRGNYSPQPGNKRQTDRSGECDYAGSFRSFLCLHTAMGLLIKTAEGGLRPMKYAYTVLHNSKSSALLERRTCPTTSWERRTTSNTATNQFV